MAPSIEYHILNGDVLNAQLEGMHGHMIICRECMMEGSVSGTSLKEIRDLRTRFFKSHYGITEKEYLDKSYKELVQIS